MLLEMAYFVALVGGKYWSFAIGTRAENSFMFEGQSISWMSAANRTHKFSTALFGQGIIYGDVDRHGEEQCSKHRKRGY